MDGSMHERKAPDFSDYFLADEIYAELKEAVRGVVYSRKDSEDFQYYTRIFNGNVVTPAKAVALPIDAQDVSAVLKLCNKHDLYPSIKAGGYGTAGHSINGDIVLDLRHLNGIDIEAPAFAGGGFTSLRNMPLPDAKGKEKLLPDTTADSHDVPMPDGMASRTSGNLKRRRSAESQFSYDYGLPRNQTVANLLRHSEIDKLPPRSRRRFDPDNEPVTPLAEDGINSHDMSRTASSESGTTSSSSIGSLSPSIASVSTSATSLGSALSSSSSLDGISTGSRRKSNESASTPAASGTPSTHTAGSSAAVSSSISDPFSKYFAGVADQDQQSRSSGGVHAAAGGAAYVNPATSSVDLPPPPHSFQSHQGSGSGSTANAAEVLASASGGIQRQQQGGSSSASGSDVSTPHASVAAHSGAMAGGSSGLTPGASRMSLGGGLRSEDPFSYLLGPSSSTSQGHYAPPVSMPNMNLAQRFAQSLAGPSGVLTGGGGGAMHMPGSFPTSSFIPAAANPIHPHAYVTFGAGVKQKDIDVYTAENPLPAIDMNGIPGHVSYHVPFAAHPVGSSVMLLGGFGFLSRLHGLSIDALVEAEVVLADGSIVIVNEKEHEDLWWAIRGAGPAFGVVTRYKAKAYPVPVVFAGNLIYNFHAATAVSLVKHFRDCIKAAPRELYANVLFTAGPRGKGSLVVIQICYIGPKDKGQEFLQAIASWDGEPCILNEVSEKSFLHQQDSVAQILRGKAGRQWFIRSALITSLPDEIIHKTVTEFADTPVGCTWLFELAGGAVGDLDQTCLPKSQREANFTIAAFHQWELDDDDPRCVSTAEDWIHKTLAPVSSGGPYPAFLGRSEFPDRVKACFGDNWSRLCEIKKKYDPKGLFRNSFWPVDQQGETIDATSHQPPSP